MKKYTIEELRPAIIRMHPNVIHYEQEQLKPLKRIFRVLMWKLLGLDDLCNPNSDLRKALDKIAKSDAEILTRGEHE